MHREAAVDAPRLPHRFGPRLGEALDHFARQAPDRRIVERRVEQDGLIRCERAQLGFLPRMRVRHTSRETIGQIYLPWINRMLLVLTLAVVLGFQSSSNLAAAYGIAVVGTMTIDAVLVIRQSPGSGAAPGRARRRRRPRHAQLPERAG